MQNKKFEPLIIDLNRSEQSTLLYLETCAVDYAGKVDREHMNEEDDTNIKRFSDLGLLDFGRISAKDILASQSKRSHFVCFTNRGFELAHFYRKARALRNWETKTYKKAKDKFDGR